MNIFRSRIVIELRELTALLRRRIDPWYIKKWARIRENQRLKNLPYESGMNGYWIPQVMGQEETLGFIMAKRCSVARFGDGEFELISGLGMLFEEANVELKNRLEEVLTTPLDNCLCCIPNSYGSLERYVDCDISFWRDFALWSRPILHACMEKRRARIGPGDNAILGDAQISRPYICFKDKGIAPKVFQLWKKLCLGKKLLVVEGRFSRIGIGNDLFAGAARIRRIWCPPKGAFSRYAEIEKKILDVVEKDEVILLALGATATILAYDLSRKGHWAIDVGHIDIEYMWMRMGVDGKVPIKGRYVSEVSGGQETQPEDGEERLYNVVAKIGC